MLADLLCQSNERLITKASGCTGIERRDGSGVRNLTFKTYQINMSMRER